MELKETKTLIKIGPENIAFEGLELYKGEFCTTKIGGAPGTKWGVETVHAKGGLETAKNIGKEAWEGDARAKQLNTAWLFGNKREKDAFDRLQEQKARQRYLNRRGPRYGR